MKEDIAKAIGRQTAATLDNAKCWSRYGGFRTAGGAVTPQVFEAYTTLRATCHGCHANFRSVWR